MFGLARNLYNYMKKSREKHLTIVIIGLDNAGKSTLLSAIKGQVDQFTTPTLGFGRSTVEEGRFHITFFDLGGGAKIRGIWPRYFAEVHAAIWVVDSADEVRLEEVKSVLHQNYAEPKLRGKPILIFANKQDLPQAVSPDLVSLQLALHTLEGASYNIMPSVALTAADQPIDPSVRSGLKWLIDAVSSKYTTLSKRVQKETEHQKELDRIEKAEKLARVERMREARRKQQEEEEAAEAARLAAGETSPQTEGDAAATATPGQPLTPRVKKDQQHNNEIETIHAGDGEGDSDRTPQSGFISTGDAPAVDGVISVSVVKSGDQMSISSPRNQGSGGGSILPATTPRSVTRPQTPGSSRPGSAGRPQSASGGARPSTSQSLSSDEAVVLRVGTPTAAEKAASNGETETRPSTSLKGAIPDWVDVPNAVPSPSRNRQLQVHLEPLKAPPHLSVVSDS